jgi:hypothetical protein
MPVSSGKIHHAEWLVLLAENRTATCRDTLAWFRSLPAERQEKVRTGLPADRETALLAAWPERAAKSPGAAAK